MLQLGQTAPDFTQNSTEGPIHFHDWLGQSWGILFSHPRNFTPVCTTELGEVARLHSEWDRRNVKVIGLSVDLLEAHERWAADIAETQGHALNFPLLADADRTVADLYGMVHAASDPFVTVRSVFIIDPEKRVRLILTYPANIGRNFQEILRVVDGLQMSDSYRVVTPANWKQGDPVIVAPSISSELAPLMFPQGVKVVKPYLRYVSML